MPRANAVTSRRRRTLAYEEIAKEFVPDWPRRACAPLPRGRTQPVRIMELASNPSRRSMEGQQ